MNIDTFFKVSAYASLYRAYGKTVDERKVEDITVYTRQSIRNTIVALNDCGYTDMAIKQVIIKAYNISSKEAENYL